VIVEHDMAVVMDIADRLVVLDFGRKISEGTPTEVSSDPVVIKAYLGEAH
jgi:branched-chain amino acid transport system ATP-binding protein